MISDFPTGRLCSGQWILGNQKEQAETLQDRVTSLFVALRGPLFRYIYVLVRNTAEAEDNTQECFFRLFLELQSGARIHDVKAWLFRVAHNLTIDRQRERNGRIEEGLERGAFHFEDRRYP